MEICETIRLQSERISREIQQASTTQLGIQEETITDFIINRIQLEHEGNFYTKKFTRREEGNLSGADWLWCIGGPGSWITFAVQAKIANIRTGNVNLLHYDKGRQYNLLINFCKNFGFVPRYSIYGNVDDQVRFFAKELAEFRDISSKQWSFTAIAPKHIKNLKTRSERHISSVLALSLPWSNIFCQPKQGEITLAESISSRMENLYWIFENEHRSRNGLRPRQSYKHTQWENPQPSRMVTSAMPISVLYLLTQARLPFRSPIPNISVFSTEPALKALDIELQLVEHSRQWKTFPRVFERRVERLRESQSEYLLLESGW